MQTPIYVRALPWICLVQLYATTAHSTPESMSLFSFAMRAKTCVASHFLAHALYINSGLINCTYSAVEPMDSVFSAWDRGSENSCISATEAPLDCSRTKNGFVNVLCDLKQAVPPNDSLMASRSETAHLKEVAIWGAFHSDSRPKKASSKNLHFRGTAALWKIIWETSHIVRRGENRASDCFDVIWSSDTDTSSDTTLDDDLRRHRWVLNSGGLLLR